MKDRKEVLLRAAFDLLRRAEESHFVQEAGCIVVRYDDADCDGGCLLEDIAEELNISNDEEPIPLGDKEASDE